MLDSFQRVFVIEIALITTVSLLVGAASEWKEKNEDARITVSTNLTWGGRCHLLPSDAEHLDYIREARHV